MASNCLLCDRSDGVMAGLVEGRGPDWSGVSCPRCGHYVIDMISAGHMLATELKGKRHFLAGVSRSRTDRSQKPTQLTEETLRALLAEAPLDRTLPEYVDSLLVYLAGKADRYWTPIVFDKERDYPLLFMRDAKDMNSFVISASKDFGYLDVQPNETRITTKGWERIEHLRSTRPDSRQAFVAMWFDPSMDEVWTKGFVPAIDDTKYYTPIRMKSLEHNDRIDDRIMAEIKRSGLVVADLTGNRGGVYFEAGLALGWGIPVIWTCHKNHLKDVHFDTNHYNYVVWETTDELKSKLEARIRNTVLPIRR